MFAFGMPGPMELGIILLIVIMLFGVGKLPRVMRDLGSGIKELKKGISEAEDLTEDLRVKDRTYRTPVAKRVPKSQPKPVR